MGGREVSSFRWSLIVLVRLSVSVTEPRYLSKVEISYLRFITLKKFHLQISMVLFGNFIANDTEFYDLIKTYISFSA